MKILLTGANGMLGTDLNERLTRDGHLCECVDINELDITDPIAVMNYINESRPEMIINAAAYTNVDACETESETAFNVNALGAKNLAAASAEFSIPILHFSTDYVFDGEKGAPYVETDATNPLGVYGRSKLDGENHVRELTDRHFIVRIQSLYGKHGKNFVTTIINAARERGELRVVDDQWSSPTYTKDVCKTVSQLIKKRDYGTYHVSNSGVYSWFEFTREILRLTGMENVVLNPCAAKDYPRPAKRPRYSPLENKNLKSYGYETPRPVTEALEEFIKTL